MALMSPLILTKRNYIQGEPIAARNGDQTGTRRFSSKLFKIKQERRSSRCHNPLRQTIGWETEMAYPDLKQRLDALCSDPALTEAEKIATLRQMETDARARLRATNENMPSTRPEDGEELKVIENALLSLGVEPTDPGAATL